MNGIENAEETLKQLLELKVSSEHLFELKNGVRIGLLNKNSCYDAKLNIPIDRADIVKGDIEQYILSKNYHLECWKLLGSNKKQNIASYIIKFKLP